MISELGRALAPKILELEQGEWGDTLKVSVL
jgi:hypothetical protein